MPYLGNVRGRVGNTNISLSKPLIPLFEAITNSIHAIEDAAIADGQIVIRIQREQMSLGLSLNDNESVLCAINGFIIEDNGIGLDKENFKSFNTSDSDYKQDRGGKGLGRHSWLVAFEYARVSSIYKEGDKYFKREFDFTLDYQGEQDATNEEVDTGSIGTKIHLVSYKKKYLDNVPRNVDIIALHIIAHIFKYYVLENVPSIKLIDFDGGVTDLSSLYKDLVISEDQTHLKIKIYDFEVRHFMLKPAKGLQHQMNYCANNWVVESERLVGIVSNLTSRITNEEGDELIYSGYVSSAYLDSHSNSERSRFDFVPDESLFEGEVTWNELESEVLACGSKYLAKYTHSVKEQKEERARHLVNEKMPQHRYLVATEPELLDRLKPNFDEEDLETLLHQRHLERERETQKRGQELLKKAEEVDPNDEDLLKKIQHETEQFMQDWNGLKKDNLARYIIMRRMTLDVVNEHIKKREDNRYSPESVLHGLVMPIKATSNMVDYRDHNLWIIDERLSYHYFLASEIDLRSIEYADSDSLERPDILIFNKPFAWVAGEKPFQSIVIIEFKKPMRKNYKDEDYDPLHQIKRYADHIRTGRHEDREGVLIPYNPQSPTPIYGYAIADLTTKIQEQCVALGLTRTPDGEGYLGYHRNWDIYFEVISYSKLVRDARKRNQILFDALNMPLDTPNMV